VSSFKSCIAKFLRKLFKLSAAEFLFPGEYYTCAGYEVAPISSQRYRTDPKSRQSSDSPTTTFGYYQSTAPAGSPENGHEFCGLVVWHPLSHLVPGFFYSTHLLFSEWRGKFIG